MKVFSFFFSKKNTSFLRLFLKRRAALL